MLKIYGSMQCPDCVECCEDLKTSGVSFEFLDFDKNLRNLKEFLVFRDTLPLFNEVKASGSIGIPCIVRDDGSVTLSWEEYVSQDNA